MTGSVRNESSLTLQTREFHAALSVSINEKDRRHNTNNEQESTIPSSQSVPTQKIAPSKVPHSQSSCRICVGVLTYSRDMWLQRSPPICRGLSFPVGSTKSAENWDRTLSAEKIFSMDDVIDEISREKHSAGDKVSPSKALSKEFPLEPRELYEITYLAFGISLYIDKWVPNGPFGRPIMGFAAHAVHTNPNAAFTKGLIAKKQREVEQAREAKRHKQLERDDDPSNTDDGATLVEKDPFSGLKKPSLPTRFPSDMSLNQFLEEAADKSKQLIGSVCDFWSRRVEGLMENYVDSSRRILHQMPKVLISFPHDASMTIRRMSTHFGTVFEDVRRDVRDTWNEEMQERKLKEEREKNETKQHESKRGPSGKV